MDSWKTAKMGSNSTRTTGRIGLLLVFNSTVILCSEFGGTHGNKCLSQYSGSCVTTSPGGVGELCAILPVLCCPVCIDSCAQMSGYSVVPTNIN